MTGLDHRLSGRHRTGACAEVSDEDRGLQRRDLFVPSDPGITLHVREIRIPGASDRRPILLVHGGGPGGIASFDLPVPGYSLAADLARVSSVVYIMDVRGWGGSTRPPALEAPPGDNRPAVRSDEAARDIAAVVAAMRVATGHTQVALLGWATGGHWSALYAARHPDAVSHLVMLNSLYGVDAPWGMRAAFEVDGHPGEFDPGAGAYILRNGTSLLARWDRSIPTDDKSEWRDPRVAAAYVSEALASDPQSEAHDPPAMRIPIGFQFDSYEMSRGVRFWSAEEIRAATLVVRGTRDFWSRPADLDTIARELVNAPRVRTVTIPDGTHYLHNDRPERGRRAFLDALLDFLST
jgi:pimeloyl-ACP methyl ester carboxylesterase